MSGNNLWCSNCESYHHVVDECGGRLPDSLSDDFQATPMFDDVEFLGEISWKAEVDEYKLFIEFSPPHPGYEYSERYTGWTVIVLCPKGFGICDCIKCDSLQESMRTAVRYMQEDAEEVEQDRDNAGKFKYVVTMQEDGEWYCEVNGHTFSGETRYGGLLKAIQYMRKTSQPSAEKQMNLAYARLRSDPIAWKNELEEREVWDGTLLDGIEFKESEEGKQN